MNEFQKKVLGNNVTVLFEKRNIPVVSLSITTNNGAEFETEKEKGISHFIEHFVFKGTKTRTGDEIAREIEKRGGVINAYTSEEVTSFLAKLPPKHVDVGFDILSDVFFNPSFLKEEFEKEKKVIMEELRMYKDNPIYHVHEVIKDILYKKPFGMFVGGNLNSVGNMTRQMLVDSYHRNYRNKTTVCVVGNADFDQICDFASKFPKCNGKLKEVKIEKSNKEEVEKRKGLDQAHFVFGYHSPFAGDDKRHLYNLVLTYLGGGMSSVLNTEIREKRGLAYAVKSDILAEKNFGYSTIYVGTVKENLATVKKLILKGFKDLSKMKQKDFDEVKEQMIGLREISEEDSMHVMNSLVLEDLGKGAEEYYKFDDKINALKFSDVKNFKLPKHSTFALVPA